MLTSALILLLTADPPLEEVRVEREQFLERLADAAHRDRRRWSLFGIGRDTGSLAVGVTIISASQAPRPDAGPSTSQNIDLGLGVAMASLSALVLAIQVGAAASHSRVVPDPLTIPEWRGSLTETQVTARKARGRREVLGWLSGGAGALLASAGVVELVHNPGPSSGFYHQGYSWALLSSALVYAAFSIWDAIDAHVRPSEVETLIEAELSR